MNKKKAKRWAYKTASKIIKATQRYYDKRNPRAAAVHFSAEMGGFMAAMVQRGVEIEDVSEWIESARQSVVNAAHGAYSETHADRHEGETLQ
jgi:hypothetical protein